MFFYNAYYLEMTMLTTWKSKLHHCPGRHFTTSTRSRFLYCLGGHHVNLSVEFLYKNLMHSLQQNTRLLDKVLWKHLLVWTWNFVYFSLSVSELNFVDICICRFCLNPLFEVLGILCNLAVETSAYRSTNKFYK